MLSDLHEASVECKAAITLLALMALVACAWLISKGWRP